MAAQSPKDEEGSLAKGRLLAELRACVSEWDELLGGAPTAGDPRARSQADASAGLGQRARAVGFGGIAFHLDALTQHVLRGELAAAGASLEVVQHLMEQARYANPASVEVAPLPPPLLTGSHLRAEEPKRSLPLTAAASATKPIEVPKPIAPIQAGVAPAAPNLLVRSMLGLRAFSKRNASAASQLNDRPARDGQESLLQLQRNKRAAELQPPPLLDRLPSGLPALELERAAPAAEAEPTRVSRPPAHASATAQPQHGRRRGQRASRLAEPREPEWGWKAGLLLAIAAPLLLAAIIGVIVGLRHQQAKSAATGASAAAATPSGAAPLGDLPEPRLSTDDEQLRELKSLLARVHGDGKESPELRAVVDEEAALLAKQQCQDNSAVCAAAAKLRSDMFGRTPHRPLSHRSAGSSDGPRTGWLVGLKQPEFPVEGDARVKKSFDFYTQNPQGREVFQQMLFRCGAHRDLIQSTLIRYGLPADVLAVVFAESGCEPMATSPVGAAGLWQFMPSTARGYHLRVIEAAVDERRSPPKSTEAAIRYLRDLHDKVGSWDLTFAAYNMGPFGLLARIEQQKQAGATEVGFWDLVDAQALPDETADYAPRIQAIALILNNLQRLKFAGIQLRTPQLTADLEAPPGIRLGLVARAAAMSLSQLHTLNLDISGENVPNVPNFSVQVPKDVVWQARDTLKDLLNQRDDDDLCVPPSFDWGRQRFTPEMAAACRRKLPAGMRDTTVH